MKLKIQKVRDGSFKGDEGEPVEWYWVKGETEDGVTIEFGTPNTIYEAGQTVTVDIEKTEKPGGKGFKYREARD